MDTEAPICCRSHWEAFTGRKRLARDGVMWEPLGMPFMVCKTCGNKRCPKATDCALPCTGSNEQGQVGSAYE